MRVKLRAEQAGLASVTIENEQIVLRYPPLPDGAQARSLPSIGFPVRAGKNAYWMPVGTGDEWKERLLESLSALLELDLAG